MAQVEEYEPDIYKVVIRAIENCPVIERRTLDRHLFVVGRNEDWSMWLGVLDSIYSSQGLDPSECALLEDYEEEVERGGTIYVSGTDGIATYLDF